MNTINNRKDWKNQRRKQVLHQKVILGIAAAVIALAAVAIFIVIRVTGARQVTAEPGATKAQAIEMKELEQVKQAQQEAEEASFDKPDKFVALTFDDGPGPETGRLLDELKKRDVKATFFILGIQVPKYPDTVKRIGDEGHEIGTHSQTHSRFTKLEEQQVRSEIEDSVQAITAATEGTAPTVLRPPGGLYDEAVQALCREYNLPIILWSVDPKDWEVKNADAIVENVFQTGDYGVADGSIILMHDIYETSVDASIQMIDRLIEEGYGFKTVSELMTEQNDEYLPGEMYRKATGTHN